MIQMITWLSVVMMHIHRVSQDLSFTISCSITAGHIVSASQWWDGKTGLVSMRKSSEVIVTVRTRWRILRDEMIIPCRNIKPTIEKK